MNFILVNNKEEYIKFINDTKDNFGCIEDWEDYFGFKLKWDETTGDVLETIFEYQGEIKYCPDSFPAIVYSLFEDIEIRYSQTMEAHVVDFVTFKELGLE